MDLPAIQPETFEQVLNTDGRAVRTSCAGEPGHPLMVDAALAAQLCRYEGEGGLRGAMIFRISRLSHHRSKAEGDL